MSATFLEILFNTVKIFGRKVVWNTPPVIIADSVNLILIFGHKGRGATLCISKYRVSGDTIQHYNKTL